MTDRFWRGRPRLLASAVAVSMMLCGAGAMQSAQAQTPWSFAGADLSNTHATYTANDGNQLAPSIVRNLKLKWSFQTNGGSVIVTPTVEPGALYVPDTYGYLYKINPSTGQSIWTHKIGDFTGNYNSWCRTSPAISGNTLVIGESGTARIIAIDKNSGNVLWTTRLNNFTYGTITAAPSIYNGVVYVGVAGSEEAYSYQNYTPTAQGSVAALDLATGRINWQFTTVPYGYSGGGVWGSSVVVSPYWGSVFVGTGNNYSIPQAAANCVAQQGGNQAKQLACLNPSDYIDSVLSINMYNGQLKWARRLGGADTWMPLHPVGRDADFSSGVNLMQLSNFYSSYDDYGGKANGWLLGAGEKGGMYWGINPANGGLFWSRFVGYGDILWGTAVGNLWSDYYIFTATDTQSATNNLIGQVGQGGVTWHGGYWSAIQASTGKLIWQVPAGSKDVVHPNLEASAAGSLSFTNGLVFGGDTGGNLTVLDGRTGYKWWNWQSGVYVKSSPAIFNNEVYWGVGYQNGGAPGNHVYAFTAK